MLVSSASGLNHVHNTLQPITVRLPLNLTSPGRFLALKSVFDLASGFNTPSKNPHFSCQGLPPPISFVLPLPGPHCAPKAPLSYRRLPVLVHASSYPQKHPVLSHPPATPGILNHHHVRSTPWFVICAWTDLVYLPRLRGFITSFPTFLFFSFFLSSLPPHRDHPLCVAFLADNMDARQVLQSTLAPGMHSLITPSLTGAPSTRRVPSKSTASVCGNPSLTVFSLPQMRRSVPMLSNSSPTRPRSISYVIPFRLPLFLAFRCYRETPAKPPKLSKVPLTCLLFIFIGRLSDHLGSRTRQR